MSSLLCAEDEEEREQQRVSMLSPSKNVLQTPGFKSGLLVHLVTLLGSFSYISIFILIFLYNLLLLILIF